MSTTIPERRGYFRINDTVNLSYKVIDDQTLEKLSHISSDILGDYSLGAALDVLSQEAQALSARLERKDPEFLDYLKILDKKVNLVAQTLMMQDSRFSEQNVRDVNLSATGLAFRCEHQLEIGQNLEIRMLLPSCMAVIVAYGRVIYCQQQETVDEDYPYTVSIEYVNMKENDGELLIKHVVKKQLQQLRDVKEN